MPVLNGGKTAIAQLVAGEAINPFDATNAVIKVGSSSIAFNEAHADLQGTTAQKVMDATYPQRTGNQITFRSTFDTPEANFDWNEWGISNGVTLLNRKVESLGTKLNIHVWQLTVTLTFASV